MIWDGVQDWGTLLSPEVTPKGRGKKNHLMAKILFISLFLSPGPEESEQHKLQVIYSGSLRREREAGAAPLVLPLSALSEPIIPGNVVIPGDFSPP